MKKKRFAAFIVSAAIIFAGVSFSGCGSNSSAVQNSNSMNITDTTIEGTLWMDYNQRYSYSFNNTKRFTVTAGVVNTSRYTSGGTYSLDNGTLTLTYSDGRKEIFHRTNGNDPKAFSMEKSPYSLYTNQSAAEDSIAKGTGQASSRSSK